MKKKFAQLLSLLLAIALLVGIVFVPGTVTIASAETTATETEETPIEFNIQDNDEPEEPETVEDVSEEDAQETEPQESEPAPETAEAPELPTEALDPVPTEAPEETKIPEENNEDPVQEARGTKSPSAGEMLIPAGFKMYRHYKVLNVVDEVGVDEDFEFHLKYVVENGNTHPAYCLYPAKQSGSGHEGDVDTGNVTLNEVWWGTKRYGTINGERAYMTEEQRRTITLILAYADSLGNRNIYDEMAVQMLVWDVLGRYRDESTFAVKSENASAYAAGWTMMANNFMYLAGNTSHLIDYGTSVNGNWVWHGQSAISISSLANARQRYLDLATLVGNHLQGKTIPSFATASLTAAEKSSHTYNMTFEGGLYVVELVDTNGVLQYYNFSAANVPNGVTVTKIGNTLRITATPEARAAINGFTFQATGSALPDSVVDFSGVLIFSPDESAIQPTVSYIGTTPDPITARFWLLASLTPPELTLKKTVVGGGNVAGYTFNLYKFHWGTLRLESDGNGNLFKIGSNPRVYTFTNIENGEYILREYNHGDNTALKSVTVTVKNNGQITYQETFDVIWHEDNGDSTIRGDAPIVVDTVTDGSKVEFQFVNAPIQTLTIKKALATGTTGSWSVNGFEFRVSKWNNKTNQFDDLGTYFTENDGTEDGVIAIPNLFDGDRLRIEEVVPDGWTCGTPNPKEITISSAGNNIVTFTNTPPASQVRVIKTSDDGNVANIPFRIYSGSSSSGPWTVLMDRILTNGLGEFSVAGTPGQWLKIEELADDPALADYVCEQPKTIRLVNNQTVSVSFHNSLSAYVDLIKTSPVSEGYLGITFNFYECDANGVKLSATPMYTAQTVSYLGEDGKTYGRILTPKIFSVGQYVLVEEIVPAGYSSGLENDSTVIGPLVQGVNAVDFENSPVYTFKIVKTSDDYDPNAEYDQNNPNPIEGIEFEIFYVKDANTEVPVTTGRTNANGEIIFNTGEGTVLFFGNTYRIVELTPPGYTATPASQTITIGLGENIVYFNNTPDVGLQIKKTSQNGQVSNISFRVSKIENNVAVWTQNYTTNASGLIDIPNVAWGDEYEIEELPVTGMVVSGDNPVRVVINQLGTTVVRFHNVPSNSLTIQKVSPDGNVDNWDFLVELKDGDNYTEIGTYNTGVGNDGIITVPGVVVGKTYRITEIQRTGYKPVNPKTITIRQGQNTVKFQNTPVVTVIIQKVSADGKIANIQFSAEKWQNNQWRRIGLYFTDANGQINIPDLDYGTKLRIREMLISEEYVIETPEQIVTLTEPVTTVTFVNTPITSLTLTKTSDDGNVGGIWFAVERFIESDVPGEPGEFVPWSRVKTNSAGRILFDYLPGYDGLYGVTLRFTEEVPEGYIATPVSQTITIQKGSNTVAFSNKRIVGKISITKLDPERARLQGAVFSLYNEDGTLYGTSTSNNNGLATFSNVPYGRYTLVETSAPAGYELDPTEHTVIITEMNQTITFTLTNAYKEGKIQVQKVDEDGNPVEGVVFQLQWGSIPDSGREPRYQNVTARTAGSAPQIGTCTSSGLTDGKLTTDASGYVEFSGLYVGSNTNGERIRYRLTEVSAPDGYEPVTGYLFNGYLFDNEDFTASINVENVRIKGSLQIVKVDENDETILLDGAGFNLYDVDMNLIDSGITENGVLEFTDLPYGHYYYQEYQAPEGYELDNTVYEFQINTQGQVISHTRLNHQVSTEEGSITIYKIGPSGAYLSGVTFCLEYSLDNTTWQPVVYSADTVAPGNCSSEGLSDGQLTTDANGVATFTGLFVGSESNPIYYRVTETATRPGLTLLAGSVFEGTLYSGENPDVVIYASNGHVFLLPHTGAPGFRVLALAGVLTALGACLLYLALRKKKGKRTEF